MTTLTEAPSFRAPRIQRGEFEAFRRLIFERTGIALSPGKREFLSARLASRMRRLEIDSYAEYLRVVLSDADGREQEELINAVTTNKTHFFREPHHFEFLRATLEAWRSALRPGERRRLRIWSAGCSTGEEPLSIAMTVLEVLSKDPRWDVRILASDIDTSVLAHAESGTYLAGSIAEVPGELRERYFDDLGDGRFRACSRVRNLVRFRSVNLVAQPWPFGGQFDFIFCRNVMIYFDEATRERVVRGFVRHLAPGGYLVIGHSEQLQGLSETVVPLRNTVYRAARQGVPDGAPASPCEVPSAPSIRIVAGGVYASNEPAVVCTVLGSCVAACLYDPVSGVGGMNHFMLPEPGLEGTCQGRYGVHAMEMLINDIMRCGGDRRQLRAKAFGGASVLQPHVGSAAVPEANVRFVREFLHREGIPITAEKLGGVEPLELRFHTRGGRAQVRVVARTIAPVLVRDEERYEHEIEQQLRHLTEPTLFA